MSTLAEIERLALALARRSRALEAAAAARIVAANSEAAASEALATTRAQLDVAVRQYVANVEAGERPPP